MDRGRKALARLLAEQRPQAKSLVVSVFGDVVEPHGGAVWLGTLVRWLAPFGIAERNVRTAVTRLVNEGWLERTRFGRRSELSLGAAGRHRTVEADRRIYAPAPPPWKDAWSIVLLGHCALDANTRNAIARDLALLGFGEVSPWTFAHPAADAGELDLVLQESGLAAQAVVLAAASHPRAGVAGQRALSLVASNAWDLDGLAVRYEGFIRRFAPLLRELAPRVEPEPAFRARVLAVHEYRRIVLRDPQLPAELLPGDWAGARARSLLGELYALVLEASAQWILASGESSAGEFPAAGAAFRRRFRQSSRDL